MKEKAMEMVLICILLLNVAIFTSCSKTHSDTEGIIIDDILTNKARYNPGKICDVELRVSNVSKEDVKGSIKYRLRYLDQIVLEGQGTEFEIPQGDSRECKFGFELPEDDYKGYMLEVYTDAKGYIDKKITTGVDVSSDWTRYPRYGYIASYPKQNKDNIENTIKELNKYHINGLQFYDWQYKHQQPVKIENDNLTDDWIELANRKVSVQCVKDYIDIGHEYNIASMNYNLLFGAWKDYAQDGVKGKWGLFVDKNGTKIDYHPLPDQWASNKLFLFDPNNKEWQDYIIGKEQEVFKYLQFDGWHIDQLGDRGIRYDAEGKAINLKEGYVSLLNSAKDDIKDKKIVFNAVNGYAQRDIAKKTDVDFLYAEIWDTSKYSILKKHIDQGGMLTDYKKPVVLAAYMNYEKKSGVFNEPSVLLTDSVIFASGGAHIELGDGGMLSNEYFPNDKLKMSDKLKSSLRKYYDFAVAYQNYLRYEVEPVYRKLMIEDVKTSSISCRKSIWYLTKQKGDYDVVHLINFLDNTSENWRDDKGEKVEPTIKENLVLKYYIDDPVEKVLLASPDRLDGISTELSYEVLEDKNGKYLKVIIPSIKYWDMLLIKKTNCEG